MHEEYAHIVDGSRKAVLMIHGIAGSPDHFRQLLPLIPADWSVRSLLLPGHGGSPMDFGRSSMSAWRSYALEALQSLCRDHDRIVIAAHSMGTLFALQGALQYLQVKGLLLLNCPLRVKYPLSTIWLCLRTTFGSRDQAASDMRRATSIQLRPWLWQYLSWAPRFWELLVEIGNTRPLVRQLQLPAVCFLSRKDELVRMSTQKLLTQNPLLRLETLPDSGHYAYAEADMEKICQAFRELLTDAENTV